jgi:ABC-type glycerol-3-phosphate transport system substrate-binding protein
VSIRVWPKKDHGPGGLLDLLRTASPVAPGALPDVIGLDDADLALAAREGLIQPVDDLLAAQTEADLFDFARRTARIDGKRMGMPWVADFDHTALSLSRFKVFPATWTDLISDSISFPFAIASGPDVSDAVLADYESLGGTIISEDSQPTLSIDPLTKLLIQYRDGRAAGVISAASADWTDAEAAWAVFRASPSAITAVRASDFLSVRAQEIDLDFARMPVIEGSPAPPIGRSWSLALVARDPRRQALAAGLIAHLTRPDNAVAWTQARRVLPASAGALQMWASLNGYTAFTLGELKRAVPPPSPAALDAVSPAFLTAVRDVLAGRATPQQAAAAAVRAVSGGGK